MVYSITGDDEIMKCPGQNQQFWKPDDIKELQCPACGAGIEFWKDEIRRKCHFCGQELINPEKDLGCAMWCKLARECLGLSPYKWKEIENLRKENRKIPERKIKPMKTKTKRKIIQIDEDKCVGCGECIISCAEGALHLIDGKAKLVSEKYCDGLGACLGECPHNALKIVEKEADEFDEKAVEEYLKSKEKRVPSLENSNCCPGATAIQIKQKIQTLESERGESLLTSWPVKIELANPANTIFKESDLLITSDCVPFVYRYFHEDFLQNKIALTGCPKLNHRDPYKSKLTEIIKKNSPRSITIARMEVPCCSGMTFLTKEAIKESGIEVPFNETIVKINGTIYINEAPTA